jgi:hypothetical protein
MKNLLSIIAFPIFFLLAYITLFFSGFIGFDSAVFIYGGESIHSQESSMLFWDNKGPFLYLINYLGQTLNAPYGFYILEGFFLSAALCCSNFLLRTLIDSKFIIYSNFLLFLTYLHFFDGGNFTETYQLGLNLICFSILIHFYFYNAGQSNKANLFFIFVIGLSISIGFLMRPNNILGLCIAAIAILFLYKRNIYKGLVSIVLGLSLPIVFMLMLYSPEKIVAFYYSFIEYNFLIYSTALDPSIKIKGILLLIEKIDFSVIMLFLLIAFFGLRTVETNQSKHIKLLNIFAIIFSFDLISQFISGHFFNHYLLIPITSLYFFLMSILISKEQKVPKTPLAILFILFLIHLIPISYAARGMMGFYSDGFNNSDSRLSKINHMLLTNVDIKSNKILIIDTPQLLVKNQIISTSRYIYTPLFKSDEFKKEYATSFINDFLDSKPEYIFSSTNRSFLNQKELSSSNKYKLARDYFEVHYKQILIQHNYEIWKKVL